MGNNESGSGLAKTIVIISRTLVILLLSLHASVFVRLLSVAASESGHVIKTLPGFDGNLPFNFETGYVGVGKNDEMQMFYYFIESEGNPQNDPILLSLTGGPGCSALSTMFFEYGPFIFDTSTTGRSIPSIVMNPYSWTKVANIIFLEWPVGTGFSYATTSEGHYTSDSTSPNDIYMFLRKWLLNHPKFIKNPVIIGGVSYAGKTAPTVAWEIAQANEHGLLQKMHLQGYYVGNPWTNEHDILNARVGHARDMALISDEYLKEAERSCMGEYVNVDTTNTECQYALQVINECVDGVNFNHVLEPSCRERNITSRRNEIVSSDSSIIRLRSEIYGLLTENWANNRLVREALHIRKGTKGEWIRCNASVALDEDIDDTVDYHLRLAKKGYHALVYSGDHDLVVPYTSSIKWIQSLNLAIDQTWRSWRANGKVAGYMLRYKGNGSYLTFATVKGAGHTAAENKPEECLAMISRWLSQNSL